MNKSTRPLSVLAAMIITTLAGCTLEPDYERPAMPVPAGWNEPLRDTPNTVADISWRSFFNEPATQHLITLALANNRDLRVAALNVDIAQAQFRVDRAALFPTLNATASETAQRLPSDPRLGGNTTHSYNAGLSVTAWELDFFGKIRSLKHQGLEKYLSAVATQQAVKISLIAEVASGYMTLCADNDLLTLAKQTLKSQQQTYNLTKSSFDNGVSNLQELAQVETTVRVAQADVVAYTRQVQQDLNALSLLVGSQLPFSIAQDATLNKDWNFPTIPAGLPADLLTRRPDIIAAEHDLKAANANIGAARAAFFPSITLTASGGTASSSLDNLFSAGSAAWSFTPTITLPIFDGGRNRANLDIAELSKLVEVANYEKAIQQAFREVNDSLIGQSTYARELEARKKDTAANQLNYNLANMRYQHGVDSFLDSLVAQRSLYAAQQTQIGTQLAMLNQEVTFYKVLGGGWRE